MEAALRQIRIIWGAMLLSVLLYAFVSFRIPSSTRATPSAAFIRAIGLLSVGTVFAIFTARRLLLRDSPMQVPARPDGQIVVTRWRMAHILTWALCEAIALDGLVLHFTGFAVQQAAPFFIAGFALMLFYAPRRPVATR